MNLAEDEEDFSTYFTLRFLANPEFLDIHKQTQYSKYEVKCVFFDYNLGVWSDQGLQVQGFDTDTGAINCISTHLSTFSVVYGEISVEEITGFYQTYSGFYGFAITFSLIVILIVVLVALFCRTRVRYSQVFKSAAQKTFLSMVWPTMKVYHPLV